MKALLAILVAVTTAAPETVWWETDGAAVVGRDNECSIFVYQKDDGLVFSWGKQDQHIVVVDQTKQFPASVSVAVQIGTTWLNDPAKLDAQAAGQGNALAMATASLDPLISADHVTIKTQATEITMPLPQAKMPQLLAAANKCRKLLR